MRKLAAIFLLLCLCGCVSDYVNKDKYSGVVRNVSFCQEDACYTTILIEFDNNEILKCRSFYTDCIVFKKGVINVIDVNELGVIQDIQYAEAQDDKVQ